MIKITFYDYTGSGPTSCLLRRSGYGGRVKLRGAKEVIKEMKMLHMAAYALLWVGGVNLGLVGLFNYNLVDSLLGGFGLTNIVYILVGLSAVYSVATHMGDCKVCGKS